MGDGKFQSVTHYDELGRVVLTRVTDGTALSTSPTATDGIKVSTTYISASGGNRVVTSTPYRTTSDPTLEWSCTQLDLLGRVTASAMFKGYAEPDDCSDEPNRTGIAYVTYDADRTETTDPAGKARDEFRDGLGRLVTVTEDPGGSFDSDTDYTYDPLGNLLTVDQGTQTRTFEYSSLGRLLEAVNPENGTVAYSYDTNFSATTNRLLINGSTYDAAGNQTVYARSCRSLPRPAALIPGPLHPGAGASSGKPTPPDSACDGCASAALTLRLGIEQKLRDEIPEFGDLIPV